MNVDIQFILWIIAVIFALPMGLYGLLFWIIKWFEAYRSLFKKSGGNDNG